MYTSLIFSTHTHKSIVFTTHMYNHTRCNTHMYISMILEKDQFGERGSFSAKYLRTGEGGDGAGQETQKTVVPCNHLTHLV